METIFQTNNFPEIDAYIKEFQETKNHDDWLNKHPLHYACTYGNLETVHYILKNYQSLNDGIGSFVIDAVYSDQLDIVQYLLTLGFEESFGPYSALEYSCKDRKS